MLALLGLGSQRLPKEGVPVGGASALSKWGGRGQCGSESPIKALLGLIIYKALQSFTSGSSVSPIEAPGGQPWRPEVPLFCSPGREGPAAEAGWGWRRWGRGE